jgi:hypothetical protein
MMMSSGELELRCDAMRCCGTKHGTIPASGGSLWGWQLEHAITVMRRITLGGVVITRAVTRVASVSSALSEIGASATWTLACAFMLQHR